MGKNIIKNRNKSRKELDRNESNDLDLDYNEFRIKSCGSGTMDGGTMSGSTSITSTSTSARTGTASHSGTHKKSSANANAKNKKNRHSQIISILKSMEEKEMERKLVDHSIDNLYLLMDRML